MTTERFTVSSKDGVAVSVQKAGSGPALLLIHGAMLNATLSWGPVLSRLAKSFTVYAMDRRGRAPSGDAKEYSIANEADDIAAVVEAIAAPVTLLAHSYGARSTLEALDRLNAVSHLVLYEPPITFTTPPNDAVAKMEQALAANDRAQVLTIFLRDQLRVPPDRIDMMRSSPIWPIVLEIAPTLPRESRAVNTLRPPTDRLKHWKVPTTVLLGGVTLGLLKDAAFFLRDTIPGCNLVILEGQGHSAMLEAPDLFTSKILEIA